MLPRFSGVIEGVFGWQLRKLQPYILVDNLPIKMDLLIVFWFCVVESYHHSIHILNTALTRLCCPSYLLIYTYPLKAPSNKKFRVRSASSETPSFLSIYSRSEIPTIPPPFPLSLHISLSNPHPSITPLHQPFTSTPSIRTRTNRVRPALTDQRSGAIVELMTRRPDAVARASDRKFGRDAAVCIIW